MSYRPTFLPDGQMAYDPSMTERDHNEMIAGMEDWMLAEGYDALTAHMRASELKRQAMEKRERWGEWQRRVLFPRWAAQSDGSKRLLFTCEELQFLAEHFDGANDPMAQSILAKVKSSFTS